MIKRCRGLAMTLVIGVLTSGGRADWTEFRGPSGQGISTAANLPLHWSPKENIRWSIDIPGQGWSSPVVSGQRVYVSTAIPGAQADEHRLCLLILDADSGRLVRRVTLFHQTAEAPSIHSKNSHASPTPVIEEDRVYVHFGHQGTACVDLDGTAIWRNSQINYEPQHGNGGSPVLTAKLLVFSCDGASDPFVIALDKHDGRPQWRVPRQTNARKTFSFCTPLMIDVGGQPQLISPGSDGVMAYDPATGREIWRVRYDGYSVVPRPIYGHGLVYISTGFDTPIVMAIRPDGQGDVTDTHVAWTEKRGAPNTPSLLLVDDHLFMISDRGIASCLNPRTGETIWRERLGGNHSASPLYGNGNIYFQSEEGEAIVVAASPQFREITRNHLGQRTLASYAVIDHDLLIRTESSLYRVTADN